MTPATAPTTYPSTVSWTVSHTWTVNAPDEMRRRSSAPIAAGLVKKNGSMTGPERSCQATSATTPRRTRPPWSTHRARDRARRDSAAASWTAVSAPADTSEVRRGTDVETDLGRRHIIARSRFVRLLVRSRDLLAEAGPDRVVELREPCCLMDPEDVARTGDGDLVRALDPSRRGAHHDHAVREGDRLHEIVRDEQDRPLVGGPQPEELVLQDHASLRVERTDRPVHPYDG